MSVASGERGRGVMATAKALPFHGHKHHVRVAGTIRSSISRSRPGKRITLIASIATDGTVFKSTVIIQHWTSEDEIVLFGFEPDQVDSDN